VGVVLIAGGSAAGKSSVAAVLAARGLRSVDGDTGGRLARWVDADGAVVARPAAPTFEWMADHRWVWDAERLAELVTAVDEDTLSLCGHASSAIALFDRFTHVILLEIDVAPCWSAWRVRTGRTNSAESETPATFCGGGCPGCRPSCERQELVWSTPPRPSGSWWTPSSPSPASGRQPA
jgi:hypothetical protein